LALIPVLGFAKLTPNHPAGDRHTTQATERIIIPSFIMPCGPGLVGKGSPGAEPCIDLETMLELTAKAEVNGTRFDGVDIFLFEPHVNIDASDDDLKRIADKITAKGLVVGSVVAPIWGPPAAVPPWATPRNRPSSSVRSVKDAGSPRNSANSVFARMAWCESTPPAALPIGTRIPRTTPRRSSRPSRKPPKSPRVWRTLAAEGEICWGGMHSWKYMLQLLEGVGQPSVFGFQADMAHTLLYVLGANAPEHRIVPETTSVGNPGQVPCRDEETDQGPAALDHRFPRGPKRCHGQGLRIMTRPANIAWPPIPTAN
jgi:hypothetical protein